jgi:hypothetical protein
MPTYGEQIMKEFESVLSNLERLSHEGYEPSQVRDVVTSIAFKTELFLKSVILPAARPRNTFEWFIDELSTVGVSQAARDKLHVLRRKYNDAKHDPNATINLVAAVSIVRDGFDSIRELVSNGCGSANAPVPQHLSRAYWIAAWDHYIGGDTEVHIIIPAKSEHWLGPPSFDTIYVRMEAWDSIKAELGRLGVFADGFGLIPDSQYRIFQSESDFLGAWVFEGDYRSLITTLAKHELRQDLIPGLNRQDSAKPMILAYLLAAVDTVNNLLSDADFETRIDDQAKLIYAVPPDYKHSEYLAGGMASMFRLVPVSDWHRITGPSWVSKETFDTLLPTSRAKHPKYCVLIDDDFVLRANLT